MEFWKAYVKIICWKKNKKLHYIEPTNGSIKPVKQCLTITFLPFFEHADQTQNLSLLPFFFVKTIPPSSLHHAFYRLLSKIQYFASNHHLPPFQFKIFFDFFFLLPIQFVPQFFFWVRFNSEFVLRILSSHPISSGFDYFLYFSEGNGCNLCRKWRFTQCRGSGTSHFNTTSRRC